MKGHHLRLGSPPPDGDLVDKPVAGRGMAFSRPPASGIIAALILACLLLLPQRAGDHPAATY